MPEAPATEAPATDDVDTHPTDVPLGEQGQKALESMKAETKTARAEAAKAKAEATKAQRALDELRNASATDAEKAINAAKAEGRTEALTAANDRILRAEVKAIAAGKLSDPADAIALLDLSGFEVAEDGDVDAKAISKAIDALLADKPYLAANAPNRVPGVPVGARPGTATNGDMNAQIRRAAGRA